MIYVILRTNLVNAGILMPLLLPAPRKTMHQEQGEGAVLSLPMEISFLVVTLKWQHTPVLFVTGGFEYSVIAGLDHS